MKRKTLRYFYLKYPYKCRELVGNTVPLPYFSKEEIDCDNKYSLTYHEYKDIILITSKHICDYLASGESYKLPFEMGTIRLEKVKGGGVDWTKSEKGKIKKYKNLHLGKYRFLTRWLRKRERLQYKWIWRVRLTKKAWKYIQDKFEREPRLFNNLNDA